VFVIFSIGHSDDNAAPFFRIWSRYQWRAQLVMAASHPRRGCRLCLAEGSGTIFDMWENLPIGRKLIYSPDIYWLSTRGGANALILVMRANE